MPRLTREMRAALADGDFAVPGSRDLPIHDAEHTRWAWGNVGHLAGISASERSDARNRIIERAKAQGIDTQEWESGKLGAAVVFNAMSLNISTDDGHPNKMPFSGIMTRIDEPSDAPPDGSGGRLVTISAEAARKGLQSILGMAVNYVSEFDGHDVKAKIGIITDATIEGNAINIKGYIYAADFPEVAAEIKARKDVLGFSYEARNLFTNDPDADPVVITDATFTGAAILRKDKAAYRSTSIRATADKDLEMTKEQEKMLTDALAGIATLTTGFTTLSASVAAIQAGPKSLLPQYEPIAAKLEASAAEMDAAGCGGEAVTGPAASLRAQAAHMRKEATEGRVPSAWRGPVAAAAPAVTDVAKLVSDALAPVTASLAALGTQVADISAAAKKDSPQPERKTLSPQLVSLLAKGGLTAPAAGEAGINIGALDKALTGMTIEQRMNVKAGLKQAGLLAE